MESLDWLRICGEGETEGCISAIQVAYLVAVIVGVVLVAILARRSRDLSTATLSLMPVAIAINIAVGSIIVLLRLPIYLDSIGTVLVGVLAGPWAGALTGLLTNLIWAILPVPGGAGPTIAFFAPVAGVIGLMAGFWAGRGIFRLREDDRQIGSFLALAAGIGIALLAFLAIQLTIGIPDLGVEDEDQLVANQFAFVGLGLVAIAIGVAAGWILRRTAFSFAGGTERVRDYLAIALGITAGSFVYVLVRLLFGPDGWFATIDGSDADLLGGANLSGLALQDPMASYVAIGGGIVVGLLALVWARRSDHWRLFPVWVGGLTTGLVAAVISAPIAAGVFGGVTGAGTDALISLFRTLGLNVLQSAFAQGLVSDPLDKTMSYTIVFAVLLALPITVKTMFSRGEETVATA